MEVNKVIEYPMNDELILLKNLSIKINNGEEILDSEEDKLLSIIEKFKDYNKSQINEYFKGNLNEEECNVFYNFYKNIFNLGSILQNLQEKKHLNKEILRNYFFNGKYISKVLFSDTYRNILEYVQKDLNIKCKAEVLSDLKIYFETGCFEEDKKKDFTFDQVVSNKSKLYTEEQIFNAIINKSQKRNIAVRAIEDANNGERTIEVVKNFKTKVGIAGSGIIDCVKETPLGIVVSITTADGKIDKGAEKKQLEKHVSCLEFGILKGEFIYEKNGVKKIVSSVDQIHQVRFNLLTEFSAKKHYKLQDKLNEIGINKEGYAFLSSCMTPLIKSKKINDSLKDKIILEGFACNGISNEDLKNIDKMIIRDLDLLVKNQEEIKYLMENGAYSHILEHFENLSKFLKDNDRYLRISDYYEFCNSISTFIKSFKGSRCFDEIEAEILQEMFIPDILKAKSEKTQKLFESIKQKAYDKEDEIVNEKIQSKEDTNRLLKEKYKVSESSIELTLKFNSLMGNKNHIIDSRQKTKLKKKLNEIETELNRINFMKGRKYKDYKKLMNLTFIENLYIENNPNFKRKLELSYGFNNSYFDNQCSKYKNNPQYSEIIAAVKHGSPYKKKFN